MSLVVWSLLVMLPIAFVFHAWAHWKSAERERLLAQDVRLVLDILKVWAETWGENPETVRERLSGLLMFDRRWYDARHPTRFRRRTDHVTH